MIAFHTLSELLRTRSVQTDRVVFRIPADWLQGRTTFGGLVSALAAQSLRDVAGAEWPEGMHLRSLQTSFVGPVGVGEIEVKVHLLRKGKNVQQVQGFVQQNGETSAVVTGVFGSDRETSLRPIEPVRPSVEREPEAGLTTLVAQGMAPAFMCHIDLRLGEGGLPFSGGTYTHNRLHLRMRDEPQDVSPELVTILLADVPATPMLSQLTQPAPASSVSWDLQVRPMASAPSPDGWWRVDTDAFAAAAGYVNQTTRLWSPDGWLAAHGSQVVTVYA